MQHARGMRRTKLSSVLALLLLVAAATGCATTTTSSTTWTAQGGYAYGRPGHVEAVREVVQRVDGNPAAGAVAGAVIGGLILGGGRGPGALVGAAGGAVIGAAASQGSSVTRSYHVIVRFDDGGAATFVYGGYSPFAPGELVVHTEQGLQRR